MWGHTTHISITEPPLHVKLKDMASTYKLKEFDVLRRSPSHNRRPARRSGSEKRSLRALTITI